MSLVSIHNGRGADAVTGSGSDAMLLRDRCQEVLAGFLLGRAGLAQVPDLAAAMGVLGQFVLAPGKRLRPLFCYWGWRGAGGGDCLEIVRAAAALELFHAFALIHDDIMDASDTRRGRPTVHRALEALHRRQGWRGDAARFGTGTAILLGDLCLVWSAELFQDCGIAPDRLTAAAPLLHAMRSEVILGQYLDLHEQAGRGSLDGALRVIRYKTAKYTIERPLQIGAVLAGAGPEVLDAYSRIGIPLGEAFQLRDDILGVFGDPTISGKSNTDDLREGKPTVLMAIARERATPLQAYLLEALHGNQRLDEAGAQSLRQVLRQTGAVTSVEAMVRERRRAALAAIADAPITAAARAALTDLAARATARAG